MFRFVEPGQNYNFFKVFFLTWNIPFFLLQNGINIFYNWYYVYWDPWYLCSVHSSMETALVKKNAPKVWSAPSFKALKNVTFFWPQVNIWLSPLGILVYGYIVTPVIFWLPINCKKKQHNRKSRLLQSIWRFLRFFIAKSSKDRIFLLFAIDR